MSPHCPAPPPQMPPPPPVPLPRGPPPPRLPRPQVFLRPRLPCPPSPTAGPLALARLERTHRAASRGRRTAAEVRAAGPGERRAPPGEPRVSFDQIRRRSLGGAGGAAGRASAPGLRGGAGDPGPLFAAGVSSVLRRRGRRLRGSRRVPSARRPGRGGAGERGGGAATYRVRRSGRRTEDGGCGGGRLSAAPAAPLPPSEPADGRKNGEGRVFVPLGRGGEGPVAHTPGRGLLGRSVAPSGPGRPSRGGESASHTRAQAPEPGLGGVRGGELTAAGMETSSACSPGARWAEGPRAGVSRLASVGLRKGKLSDCFPFFDALCPVMF